MGFYVLNKRGVHRFGSTKTASIKASREARAHGGNMFVSVGRGQGVKFTKVSKSTINDLSEQIPRRRKKASRNIWGF